MGSKNSSRRGRLIASAVAAVLLAGGITTIGLGLHAEPPSGGGPAPSASAPATAPATLAPAPDTAPIPPAPPALPPAPDAALPASVPVRVEVPSIAVNAPLIPLGKQADGEIETPPGEPGAPAGWYKNSLTPGKTITVTRSDHTAAVFTVDKVDVYHKANFPTVEVYKNADRPEIRLITCGGYNPATREYLDNTVVYAHLTSTQPA
jgi:hypothetical protein